MTSDLEKIDNYLRKHGLMTESADRKYIRMEKIKILDEIISPKSNYWKCRCEAAEKVIESFDEKTGDFGFYMEWRKIVMEEKK